MNPWGLLVQGIGDTQQAGGQMLSMYGQEKYRQGQSQELQSALEQARGALGAGYGEAQGYYDPYAQAGQQAMQQYTGALGSFNPNQYVAEDYGAFDYQMPERNVQDYLDPSMQYQMEQAMGALEGSAAARGLAKSGGTLMALQERGQQMAAQDYANAYNRMLQAQQMDQGNRAQAFQAYQERANQAAQRAGQRLAAAQTQLSGLQSAGQMGMAAAGQQAGIATQRGESLGNLETALGQARAYGQETPWQSYVGQFASTTGQGISGAGQTMQGGNLFGGQGSMGQQQNYGSQNTGFGGY